MTSRRDNTTFIRERDEATRLRYSDARPGNVTPGCTLRVSTRLRMFYEIHDGGPLEGGGDVMGLLNKLEGYGGVGVSVPLQTGE